VGQAQPVACLGSFAVQGLRGFIVPDRSWVRKFVVAAQPESAPCAWFAKADAPFLTRIDVLPDESLHLVSSKLLIAPFSSRVKARNVKLVPMSFRRATVVTEFRFGWVVAATASRVTRVVVDDGQTLTVRPESVVAWSGKDPTGFCPKLSLLDLILPKGPKNLAYTFHGPCVVWFEGGKEIVKFRK